MVTAGFAAHVYPELSRMQDGWIITSDQHGRLNMDRNKQGLGDYIGEDEKLIWVKMPSRHSWKKVLRGVQVTGHVLLTGVSVLFAVSFPLDLSLQIGLGVILVICTNAPLVAWAMYRLPRVGGSGDSICFITDQRVGQVRGSGELRQAPICPGLRTDVRAGILDFRLGERSPVSFSGLTRQEALLVTSVVDGLVQKCDEDSDAPA